MSDATSRVTITLNLTGQKATVAGIEQATAALQELADVAADVSERVAAASSSEADAVAAANEKIQASSDETAASMQATADAYTASTAGVATASDSMATKVTAGTAAAGKGILGLKNVVAGLGLYEAVKDAGSYQSALTRLYTSAGVAQNQLSAFAKAANSLGPSLGLSPAKFLQASFYPASVLSTADAIRTVADAQKEAAMSGGDLTTMASGLTAILQSYNQHGTKAVDTSYALMHGIIAAGRMNGEDFGNALATGIPSVAANYGISLQSLGAAIDTMTAKGTPADVAATHLRTMLSIFASPASKAQTLLAGLGLDANEQTAATALLSSAGVSPTKFLADFKQKNGINVALQDLITHGRAAGMNNDQLATAIEAIAGGARSGTAAQQLAQAAMSGDLTARYNAIGTDAANSGKAWSAYTKNDPTYAMHHFTAELSAAGTAIGKDLLPPLKFFADDIADPILKLVQNPVAAGVLTGALGGVALLQMVKYGTKLVELAKGLEAVKFAQDLSNLGTEGAAASTSLGKLVQWLVKLKNEGALPGLPGLPKKSGGSAAENDAENAGKTVGPAALSIAGAAGLPVAGALATGLGLRLANDESDYLMRLGYKPAPTGGRMSLPTWKNAKGQTFSGPALAYIVEHGIPASSNVPGYAQGGITDGPMAIVGEGSRLWPEYVVPTDPSYRKRALALFASLGGHLLGSDPSMLLAMGPGSKASGGKNATGKAAPGAAGSNVSLGQRMAAAFGWSGPEWTNLYQLWTQESGWNNFAKNPTSGAYGIAQALPATKYPLAGQPAGGSSAAAQIAWGLSYIKQRYGDPVGAEGHEKNFGWYKTGGVLPFASYDSGGYLPEGISLAHNGTGKPEPVGHGLGIHIDQVVINGVQDVDGFLGQLRKKAARR